MNEIKVGERVTIILEAVEHDTCEGCFFKGVAGYCGAAPLGLKCLPKYRSEFMPSDLYIQGMVTYF